MEPGPSDGEVINVGSGRPITIRRVAEILAASLGKPELAPVITQRYRAGDIRHCFADLTRAHVLLGYQPQVTHAEGFRELAEPGKEILVVKTAEDVVDALIRYDSSARRRIGDAFHTRALRDHTYAQRALQAEAAFEHALAARRAASHA